MSTKQGLLAQSRKRAEKSLKNRKGNFLYEVKEELRKVSWTSKDELKMCTKIVVLSTIIFGIGIYVSDIVIKGVLNGFGKLVYLISG